MTTHQLSKPELTEVLHDTDLDDLHPFTANCMSVAAGIGRITPADGYVAVFGMDGDESDETGATDDLLHATVEYNGDLFDASGIAVDDPRDLLNQMRYEVYPEDLSHVRGIHTQEDVQEWLMDEYIVRYDSESELLTHGEVVERTEKRLRETVREKGYDS